MLCQVFFYSKNDNSILDYFTKNNKIISINGEQLMLKCMLSPVFTLCIPPIYTEEVIAHSYCLTPVLPLSSYLLNFVEVVYYNSVF